MAFPKGRSTTLTLPRGIAGSTDEPVSAPAGSLSYDPDSDKVRYKTLSGAWADLGPGGGGGGTITSVNAGPGITVTNPSGPSVTVEADFGTTAGTVTEGNDSRLSNARTPTGAAGGDLAGTYPNPTVTQARGLVTASTTVAVSAATAPSAGQVLTATNSTTATWQTPVTAGTGNPYIDVPSSVVSADSDEFTVDTFASGAWALWNATDSVLMSRVGDPDFFTTPNTLTSAQFRSTVKGSLLYCQIPTGKDVYAVRVVSSGNATWTCRVMTQPLFGAVGTAARGPQGTFFYVSKKVGNVPDPNNYNRWGWRDDLGAGAGNSVLALNTVVAGVSSTTNYPLAGDVNNGNSDLPDVVGLRTTTAGGACQIGWVRSWSGASYLTSGGTDGTSVAGPNACIAFRMIAGTTYGTPQIYQTIWAFDYVRRLPNTAWLAG